MSSQNRKSIYLIPLFIVFLILVACLGRSTMTFEGRVKPAYCGYTDTNNSTDTSIYIGCIRTSSLKRDVFFVRSIVKVKPRQFTWTQCLAKSVSLSNFSVHRRISETGDQDKTILITSRTEGSVYGCTILYTADRYNSTSVLKTIQQNYGVLVQNQRIHPGHATSQMLTAGSLQEYLAVRTNAVNRSLCLWFVFVKLLLVYLLQYGNPTQSKLEENISKGGYKHFLLNYFNKYFKWSLNYEKMLCKHDVTDSFHSKQKCLNLESKDTLAQISSWSNIISPQAHDVIVAPVTKLDNYFQSFTGQNSSSMDVSLSIEFLRIETFRTFPKVAPVSTIRLAEAGFFYTKESDKVECFHCHVKHSGWRSGDIPSEIHKTLSPNCHFVRGLKTENIPLLPSSDPFTKQAKSPTVPMGQQPSLEDAEGCNDPLDLSTLNVGSGVCALLGTQTANSSNRNRIMSGTTESGRDQESRHDSKLSSLDDALYSKQHIYSPGHGIMPECRQTYHTVPYLHRTTGACAKLKLRPLGSVNRSVKYPACAVLTVRMSSFKGWSSTSGHTTRSLADAGFMYTGCADVVRCFSCGVGLQNWQCGDDPWIEHAKHSPECVFLRENMGDNFIMLVHDDVIPQISSNHGPDAVPEHYDNKPADTMTSYPDPARSVEENAVIDRVLEMGYALATITETIESMKKQGQPADVYNIVHAILNTEPTRDMTNMEGTFRRMEITAPPPECREDKVLEDNLICKICLEENASVKFLPCGHTVCCDSCEFVMKKCPICRQVIAGRMKIYVSEKHI